MAKLSNNITVCIFALNEERRLARCVGNFQGLFDILVVDNFSTDKTRETALSLGCECASIKNPGFIETPEVMDRVQEHVKTDFMLIALVSEFVPFALLKKYAQAVDSGAYDVVMAYRAPITAGKLMYLDGPPRGIDSGQLRLFRKGAVDYAQNRVHQSGQVRCPPEKVLSLISDTSLQFYSLRDYDVSKNERNHCIYNDLLAKQQFESGKRFGVVRAVGSSMMAFLRAYFMGGSYRFGMLGLIHSYYRFHMVLGVWLRIWEYQNGYDVRGTVEKNNAARAQLENELERDKANDVATSTA